MIVEDYVENGPTQVKAPPISELSAPSAPPALFPDEINYRLPPLPDRRLRRGRL